MDAQGLLPKRNVEVFDHEGSVVAGFWQYGTLRWDEFCRYLTTFIVTETPWSIFEYDLTTSQCAGPCPSGAQIVQPGHYTLLSSTRENIRVGLVPTLPRPRNPSLFNTPVNENHYDSRGRERDGRCLITGLQTPNRLKVAHIFPREHEAEWVRKGYPSKIADAADEAWIGGTSKIDSVQNVITLRSDLSDAWDNYEFGVDPNNHYLITSFTNGNADINGLHLQLDHIQDPTLRPLDELFADHFVQGLLKHMKGTGEVGWTYEEYVETFRDGLLDLSNHKIWGSREGKERLELALSEGLFDHRLSQQSAAEK
ncbi:hypothetical protein M413DRAFT_271094 [Hebeloma cylindrosporum]|uniref:HNH nuclease domain-containing protein n=1 Tax=Hebeloma cylindrosporum TaxID=76867 RepID=A0A0C2YBJ8_HEBCY|nr:hypothetical protein M413DRAFT_271094 [Hebeloma cylindrosporum h7]